MSVVEIEPTIDVPNIDDSDDRPYHIPEDRRYGMGKLKKALCGAWYITREPKFVDEVPPGRLCQTCLSLQ